MKKFLSITLALLMVCVMLPVVALADEGITTADALKSAVEAGGNVTLGADITASITIPADKTVTLNLNGKTLTNEDSKDTIYVAMGGTLIIEGTGTVDNVSHACATVFNNGTVTINGGTFTRSQEKGTANPDGANGNSWYTICNHGVMTVNAGTVENKGTYSSTFENGYQSYNGDKERSNHVEGTNNAAPELTINGGTFSGGKITIKNDDGATLEINEGNFTNTWNRVVFNANEAVINGGTFNTTEESAMAVDTVGGSDVNKGLLTIAGGTFNGKITKDAGSTVTVSGGTFKKGIDESYIVDGKTINSNGTVVDKTITIISGDTTPETPKTDDQKNPATGANDVVAAAVALMAVSALGMAVLTRKK